MEEGFTAQAAYSFG